MKQIKLRIKFFVDLSTVRNENRPTSRVSPLFAAFDKLRQVNISLTTETDIRPTGLTTKVIVIWLGVFFFSAICLITVLQVDSLKIALKHLRNENIRLKSQQLKVRYQMEKKKISASSSVKPHNAIMILRNVLRVQKFERSCVNHALPKQRKPKHFCVVAIIFLVLFVSRSLSAGQDNRLHSHLTFRSFNGYWRDTGGILAGYWRDTGKLLVTGVGMW